MDFKLYQCAQCGFEYDEAQGWPEETMALLLPERGLDADGDHDGDGDGTKGTLVDVRA